MLAISVERAAAEYRFDIWTADSGLPQNTVRAILQTRDGYVWVGTLDGLARFDGVRFTVFDKAMAPALTSTRILALHEDRAGALWIGMDDGGLVRYQLGRFTRFGTQDGLTGTHIQTISGDEQGNLWVTASGNPMQWMNGRFSSQLPDNVVTLFSSTLSQGHRAGIQWALSADALGILSHGKLTSLSRVSGLPSLRIHHVDEDQYGTWWVASADGLVKVRDGKVVKVYTQQDGLPRNAVHPASGPVFPAIACEDRKGNLWVNGAGQWLGRLKDGVFTGYPSTNSLSSQPLPLAPGLASFINVLFEDREGNLWIGTEGSGLFRAREQKVSVLSTRQGFDAANIYPVLEDRAGTVWLGTWNLGLVRIRAGVVTNFALEPRHREVTALCQDRAGRLWVGTINGVIHFEDGKTSTVWVPAALTNRTVSAICEDRNGVMWFGADNALFSYHNGEVSRFTQKNGIPASISVIIEDSSGALWIGSRGGLTRLVNGRFTTWTERDGLPSNNVRALYEDGEGVLWIGSSDGGLGRFNHGRFTGYTTIVGMFDNGVFQILEDKAGNFWMSSNRGIHRVLKRELNELAEGRRRKITCIAYGKSDGMLNPECNGGRWPAGVKTRDGKLWFPTQDGVAVIDPSVLSINSNPPPIQIEAFVLDRQPQALDRPLRVPPGSANIEIQYTGLSFVNSERLSFKYRLAPVDEQWVEVGTRRMAYYSHLTPGRYTFTVLAANSDGVWGETGASMAFIVLPEWYQTLWFRGLAAAALCGAVVGLVHLRLRAAEWRRAAQEAFSRELIHQQEAERKRIAGELHDGLGQALLVIKNIASLASAPSTPAEEIRQDLAAIANLSGKAIEDIRSISHALRPPELDRLGLTKALEHIVHLVADTAGLRCSAHLEPLDNLLAPEAEIHLYRLVQECLNNVVKHAHASFVEVRAGREDGYLRCNVRDNGEGFDPAARQPNSTSRTGLGLAGMTERMRLLGGQISIYSQPGSGTMVEARLPLQPKDRA